MRELLTLRVSDIEVSNRARVDEQLDEDFIQSLNDHGVLQPITVARRNGNYILLAGGRRLAGCKKVGLDTIPCHIVGDSDHLSDKEIEFLENALRKDLKWQERLKLVVSINQLMIEKYGTKGSQSNTAKFLDRSVGGVSRIMQLNEMVTRFPSLLALPTEDEAVKASRKILEGALVKKLTKDHAAAAAEAGIGAASLSEIVGEASEEEIAELSEIAEKAPGKDPGEGFKDDPYIRLARQASNHYRIGDCFVELKGMIDSKLLPPIKLCEVDPPYGIDLQAQKKGDGSKELDIYEEIPRDAYGDWTFNLIALLDQILPADSRIIYWFAQEWYSTITEAFDAAGWNYDPIPCIWNKGSGQTNAPDLYLARTYETFFVATKGEGVPIAERGRSNVFTFPPVPAQRKYHPTQKPLELMDEILRTFGWPGSILLCPFLGSGVTLRAAYRRGMLPFGFELNDPNKPKFIAAVEEDIQNYKVGVKPGDIADKDIPF